MSRLISSRSFEASSSCAFCPTCTRCGSSSEACRGEQRRAEAIRRYQRQAAPSRSANISISTCSALSRTSRALSRTPSHSVALSRNPSHLESFPQPRQLGARRIAPLRLHLQLSLELGALLGKDGALYIGATSGNQTQLWFIRGPQLQSSIAISAHQSSSVLISAHQCSSELISAHQWHLLHQQALE